MKTFISSILFLILGMNSTIFAQTKADERTENARQTASKIGTGQKAKVEIKLRDSSKLKGYIGAVNNDSLTLVDEKKGMSRDIRFADVETIGKRGGSNKATIITFAVVAGVAAIVIGALSKRCRNELGC